MKLIVPFIRGPLHGIKFEMVWVPQVNLCIDERNRMIHVYIRDEMAYFYDPDLSDQLSTVYDIARERWAGQPNRIIPVGP